MNILIIGNGSIGMRHLQNCLEIDAINSISVVSSKDKILVDKQITIYNSIAAAFSNNQKYDSVIVATPTAFHVENCIDLIQLGIKKIYVEKPISNSLINIDELINLSIKNKVLVFVGFDMRFDLGLNKVKQLICENEIGNLISFQSEVGQYLPDWRPNENYKEGMSAKVQLGGGVLLDLVHEFDFLAWIVGKITKIYGFNEKINHLDIETEGIAVNIMRTQNGVLGLLSLDYIQKNLARNAKFIGDKGIIKWDYVDSSVKWFSKNKWQEFYYKDFERNDRFKLIIRAFLDSNFNTFDSRLTTLEESTHSLKLILEAKETNKK